MKLIHPHEREAIANQIKADINEYTRTKYDDGHREHLGASLIGKPCERHLWYVYRWVRSGVFDGRMQRLFNRGHLEEFRWIEWLEGIGCQVWATTEEGKQIRIAGVGGHFGGSLDSTVILPERYQISEPVLGEFKTYNQKTFDKLVKEGVRKAKPEHFAQMSIYGRKRGLRYALYCPICKNDDDIRPELVELDWGYAIELERKAEAVVTSQYPPPRISESPAFHECKFCDYKAICHEGAPYEKNCRSCMYSTPTDDGAWGCHVHKALIPKEFIKAGCDNWTPNVRP
jgi:hypothetical protein